MIFLKYVFLIIILPGFANSAQNLKYNVKKQQTLLSIFNLLDLKPPGGANGFLARTIKLNPKLKTTNGNLILTRQVLVLPIQSLNADSKFKVVNGFIVNAENLQQNQVSEKNNPQPILPTLAAPVDSATISQNQPSVQWTSDTDYQKKLEQLSKDATSRENERQKLVTEANKKRAVQLAQFNSLSSGEKKKRKSLAQNAANEAKKLYRDQNFLKAEEKFKEAQNLDPSNDSYFYSYGVTQYRLNKYQDALVTFKMLPQPYVNQTELQYFVGLSHLRLSELDAARTSLKVASSSTDATLGPSANFYLGVTQYGMNDFTNAKDSFETTLKKTNDSKLKSEAQSYLERLSQSGSIKEATDKPWTLTANIGVSYDSNVNYSPDTSSAGPSSKIADLRLNPVLEVNRRLITNPSHELSLNFLANWTKSSKSELGTSDPLVFDLTLPYSYKTKAWNKAYVLGIKPGYELLMMKPDLAKSLTKNEDSFMLDIDNTLTMRPDWESTYSLSLRQDVYAVASLTADADSDGMKYTLKTRQTKYLDEEKKQSLAAGLGVSLGRTKGKDKKFNRYDASLAYSKTLSEMKSWNTDLAIYSVSYYEATTVRNDIDYALSAGYNLKLNDRFTWSLRGTYTLNESNLTDLYKYNKYLITTNFIFVNSF
jgi:TolA-binding protein